MEKTLKEKQLTKLIKAKIYEAFGVVMYRVIDEATEECLENTSDLDEAIKDAKQFAARGGCYLVIDNNGKVVYKTSEISYKFENRKITEDKLRKIVAESVKRVLKEGRQFMPDRNYTHYAVNKATNKIVNGWDYRGYEPSELRQFKKHYFDVDLIDMEMNPRDYKIVTKQFLLKNGIDPQNWENWCQN